MLSTVLHFASEFHPGSNVYRGPPRKASNQPAKSIGPWAATATDGRHLRSLLEFSSTLTVDTLTLALNEERAM